MTETSFDDDLPDEEPHDPTGLELATEIAHQTARTSPLLPEVALPPPKVPKRRHDPPPPCSSRNASVTACLGGT